MTSTPVKQLLTCSICFDSLNQPKILPCFHNFCRNCLQRHYEHSGYRLSNILCCPTCRENIKLTVGGINTIRDDAIGARMAELMHGLRHQSSESCKDCQNSSLADLSDMHKADLCMGVDKIEMIVSCLRKKSLVLYRLQQLAKEASSDAIASLYAWYQSLKKDKQKTVNIQEMERKKDRDYQLCLNWMVTVQDCIYQKVGELKALLNILEGVLEKHELMAFLCFAKLKLKVTENTSHSAMMGNVDVADPPRVIRTVLPTALEAVSLLQDNSDLHDIKTMDQPRLLRAKLLFRLSGYGKQPGSFNYPTHATFLPTGDLLVCDKNNFRLQLFDEKGIFKNALFTGVFKPRRARFSATDSNVYISDEFSETVKCVQIGELAPDIPTIGHDFFVCPAGLSFDGRGNVVMSDPEKGYITVHNPAVEQREQILTKFFYRAREDEKVPNPYFVTVNNHDQIIVSDNRNNKVKIFNPSGQLLFEIPNLVVPRGLCVDENGHIFIAEGDKHCISVYNPYGEFVQELLTAEDGLRYPLSVEINKSGDKLVVTQCGPYTRHEVIVFQLKYRY